MARYKRPLWHQALNSWKVRPHRQLANNSPLGAEYPESATLPSAPAPSTTLPDAHIDRPAFDESGMRHCSVLTRRRASPYFGLELRGLASRAGPGVSPQPGHAGPGVRAVPVQPAAPDCRARSAACCPGLRHRPHSLVAAVRRPPGWGTAQGPGRPERGPDDLGLAREGTPTILQGETCAPSWRKTGRRRLGLVAASARGKPRSRPRTEDQLDGALRALELTLSGEYLAGSRHLSGGGRSGAGAYAVSRCASAG